MWRLDWFQKFSILLMLLFFSVKSLAWLVQKQWETVTIKNAVAAPRLLFLFASKVTFTDLNLATKNGLAFFLRFNGKALPQMDKKRRPLFCGSHHATSNLLEL
jgi:hypothetical protein